MTGPDPAPDASTTELRMDGNASSRFVFAAARHHRDESDPSHGVSLSLSHSKPCAPIHEEMDGSSEVDCVYIYWKDRERLSQLVSDGCCNKLAGLRRPLSLEPNGYGHNQFANAIRLNGHAADADYACKFHATWISKWGL